MIEFTICRNPSQKLRDIGCQGFLVTEARLSRRKLEAVREFWAANADRLKDGERFVVGEP